MNVNLLFIGLIFGSLGMGYIAYGRKQSHLPAILAGVGLCAFPYFVNSVWMSIVIGLALTILPFLLR